MAWLPVNLACLVALIYNSKNLLKFALVADATSSAAKFLTLASVRATSAT